MVTWRHENNRIGRRNPYWASKSVLGVEIRIGRLIEFEAGGEQSKMADDELVAMDLSRWFSICTDFLTVEWFEIQVLIFVDFS